VVVPILADCIRTTGTSARRIGIPDHRLTCNGGSFMTANTPTKLKWLIGTVTLVLIVTGCGLLTSSQDARVEETGGNIARGKDLVRTHGCVACHSMPGVSSVDNGYGPDLDGFANNRLIAGQAENEPETLIQFIMVPSSVAP